MMKKTSLIIIISVCFLLMILTTGCKHFNDPTRQQNTIWNTNNENICLEIGKGYNVGIIVNGDEIRYFDAIIDDGNKLCFRDLVFKGNKFVRDDIEVFDCDFKRKNMFTAKVIKGTHLQVGDEYVFYRVEE